jgi:hypothetical protein
VCFLSFRLGPLYAENEANRSFDLCKDSGAADAFFDANLGALVGNYEEVSCTEWRGNKGNSLWGQSCLADVGAPLWPATSCGNKGTNHSLACAVMQF